MKAFGKTMITMSVMAGLGTGAYFYLKNNKKALNEIKMTYNYEK